MNWPSGFVLFAAPDDDLAPRQAKQYVEDYGHSFDIVKIWRSETSVMVVVR